MKKSKIVFFTDLEGSILREEDGEYDDEAMFHFLEQLDKLENTMDAKVNLHIVSPIYANDMQKIMDKIDKNIRSYNYIKRTELLPVQSAIASNQNNIDYIENERVGDRIFLFEQLNTNAVDMAREGKKQYVKLWLDILKSDELAMCIYSGNGRNDIDAMKLVKETANGIVICPKNSRTEIREDMADFVSEKTDLTGLTDCLNRLNLMIKGKEKEESVIDTQEENSIE